eukprot:TRINITY_DN23394_c0_g1_i2.p1 TRINITY_DN23394_c0_g1~~TRINITY_DN23394_c0_g1_i2.p1  ORF type:complete len:170 (+),score=32.58 TRINITY_DN23394_c0_g1_i2:456-965(+)
MQTSTFTQIFRCCLTKGLESLFTEGFLLVEVVDSMLGAPEANLALCVQTSGQSSNRLGTVASSMTAFPCGPSACNFAASARIAASIMAALLGAAAVRSILDAVRNTLGGNGLLERSLTFVLPISFALLFPTMQCLDESWPWVLISLQPSPLLAPVVTNQPGALLAARHP